MDHKIVEFSHDGAWCWFQDPRAIFINGRYMKTYAQWITRKGKLQCGSYDHDTEEFVTFTLKEKWDKDDHNVGSFLKLNDNRIMIFYARHNKKGLFARITTNPEDITSWRGEIVISEQKSTYSHPVYLKDERKLFVFWRGETWKPTYSTSKDGKIWSPARIIIQDEGKENRKIRPYMKIYSKGKNKLHMVFTDGHPRDEPKNSLYYIKYENGHFRNLKNEILDKTTHAPINHKRCEMIYDANKNKIRAWVWDVGSDENDNACVLYARFPTKFKHHYHLVRWTGSKWQDIELTFAGNWFPQTGLLRPEREPHYSGGMCFNHSNTNILYLSRKINGQFEIEKWKTEDKGITWKSHPITKNSIDLNVRPIFPHGYDQDNDHILWMSGKYRHYTRFKTRILMLK